MTKAEQRLRDKEGIARRKKSIEDIPIQSKCILEHAFGLFGISDGSSNSSLLRILNNIEDARQNAPEGQTIGEAAIVFLENRLKELKALREE